MNGTGPTGDALLNSYLSVVRDRCGAMACGALGEGEVPESEGLSPEKAEEIIAGLDRDIAFVEQLIKVNVRRSQAEELALQETLATALKLQGRIAEAAERGEAPG